jgi:NAD(P)H-nitrite reductase large subunit
LDVSALEINAALAGGAGLAQLQKQLKCGTECGSCLPELKRMVNRRADAQSLASQLANIPTDVQAVSPSKPGTTLTVSPTK